MKATETYQTTFQISAFDTKHLSVKELTQVLRHILNVCGTAMAQVINTGFLSYKFETERQENNFDKLSLHGTGNVKISPAKGKELIEWLLINRKNSTYKNNEIKMKRLEEAALDSGFITQEELSTLYE